MSAEEKITNNIEKESRKIVKEKEIKEDTIKYRDTLRIGEMEIDVIIAHGVSTLIHENFNDN
jgi:hypothetical protein